MNYSNFYRYVGQNLKLAQVFVTGLFLLTLSRFLLLFRFGERSLFDTHAQDLATSFLVGSRFDVMVLCYLFIPVMALNLALLFVNKPRFQHFVNSFCGWYLSIAMAFVTLILIIDQEYYTYFQSHINVLAFGLLEDDTAAVMTSVWTDHPILLMTGSFILITWLLTKLIRKIYAREYLLRVPGRLAAVIALPVLLLGLFALGIRGSAGTFPIQQDDTTISDNEFINFLTPNGIFALKQAVKEKTGIFKKLPPEKLLKEYGYKSVQHALSDYFGKPASFYNAAKIEQYLTQQTDTSVFLEKNPPNVVFVLMESMSNYYLGLHNPEMNMLGELESHITKDMLFRNFWSGENGTIPSLEELMINAPKHPISQSAYRFKAFNSSVTWPFRQAGYETTFITGGKLGWRNLNNFAPNQGFSTAEGKEAILRKVSGAKQGEWGAFDEYLFAFVQQKLEQPGGKPKFIFALTTSNHTPFELPAHYKPYPIKLPDSVKASLLTNEAIAVKNFTNFQYANDCLGSFLTKLKASPLGQNTIVVATGDHNNFMLFRFTNRQLLQKHSVPLYLYVPEAYKKELKNLTYNNRRFGSHKDVFPTIFNLALSGKQFIGLGNNLLAPETKRSHFYGINENLRAIDSTGAIDLYATKKVTWHHWKDTDYQQLKPAPKLTEAHHYLLIKVRAYSSLMHYYFNSRF